MAVNTLATIAGCSRTCHAFQRQIGPNEVNVCVSVSKLHPVTVAVEVLIRADWDVKLCHVYLLHFAYILLTFSLLFPIYI